MKNHKSDDFKFKPLNAKVKESRRYSKDDDDDDKDSLMSNNAPLIIIKK
jgi:hypothetical protein